MSDTPRTDKEVNGEPCTRFAVLAGDSLRGASVPSEFARQLERELAAVTKERDEIPNCIAALESQARAYRKEIYELRDQLAAVTKERDELVEIANKVRIALGGHKCSELFGEHGLIAATMRCVHGYEQMQEQRDRLVEALDRIAVLYESKEMTGTIDQRIADVYDMRCIARSALAAVKGGQP